MKIVSFQHFQLKRGVLTLNKSKPSSEDKVTLKVETSHKIWKDIVTKERNPVWAYLSGALKIRPHIFKLNTFISYFDNEV